MRLSRKIALTPLIKLAVNMNCKLFGILYASPYQIAINDDFLFLQVDTIIHKYLLWSFAFFGITIACGWTSCLLIFLRQLVFQGSLPPWIQWNLLATIFATLLWFAASFETIVVAGLIRLPELVTMGTTIQHIERRCNTNQSCCLQSPNILIFKMLSQNIFGNGDAQHVRLMFYFFVL